MQSAASHNDIIHPLFPHSIWNFCFAEYLIVILTYCYMIHILSEIGWMNLNKDWKKMKQHEIQKWYGRQNPRVEMARAKILWSKRGNKSKYIKIQMKSSGGFKVIASSLKICHTHLFHCQIYNWITYLPTTINLNHSISNCPYDFSN